MASLTTVGMVLSAGQTSTTSKLLHAAAAVVSVVTSWLVVHVVHKLAYARVCTVIVATTIDLIAGLSG